MGNKAESQWTEPKSHAEITLCRIMVWREKQEMHSIKAKIQKRKRQWKESRSARRYLRAVNAERAKNTKTPLRWKNSSNLSKTEYAPPAKRFIQKWIISPRTKTGFGSRRTTSRTHPSRIPTRTRQLNNPHQTMVNRMPDEYETPIGSPSRVPRCRNIRERNTKWPVKRPHVEWVEQNRTKRAGTMQRTYQQALDAHEAENIFVEGESRARQRMAEPAQRPVAASSRKFWSKSKKRAA